MDRQDPTLAELERTRPAYDSFRGRTSAPDFARLGVRPLRWPPLRTLAAAAAIALCVAVAALVLQQRSDSRVGRTSSAAFRRPSMPAGLDMPHVSVSLDFERMRSELAEARQSYPWLGRVPTSPDSEELRNNQNGSRG